MAIDSNIWSKQFRFEGYFLEYSEGKIIWSPADFVLFAHWQRNDQSIILMADLFEQWETK